MTPDIRDASELMPMTAAHIQAMLNGDGTTGASISGQLQAAGLYGDADMFYAAAAAQLLIRAVGKVKARELAAQYVAELTAREAQAAA